ncbi:MAG: oxidoreductase [Gordonibacter sp.]
MAAYGLLIDYEWCTGCHSCEFACQMEHGFPVGQTGILVSEVGPWKIAEDVWQLAYVPAPTDQCDQCVARQGLGKVPTCVQHCQAKCLEYGPVNELVAKFALKPKQALFALGG